MSEFDNYEKDRDEAFLSLDRDKIHAWMRYYRVDFMPYLGPKFWIAVHTQRLKYLYLTPEQKAKEISEIEDWSKLVPVWDKWMEV